MEIRYHCIKKNRSWHWLEYLDLVLQQMTQLIYSHRKKAKSELIKSIWVEEAYLSLLLYDLQL